MIKLTVIAVVVAVTAGLVGGAMLWLQERRRREAFPASNAQALLNPARRLFQSPVSTVRAFGLQPGDVALEIGPGPGYFTNEAATALGPTGRLICLDLQREMLTKLRDRLCVEAPRVDLVMGEAGHLPFRDRALDAAFLVAVLGEVPDQQSAVGEIGRVLRDSGTVSFCETMNDPDYVRLGVMRRMCWDAGLQERDWRRQPLGYTARFGRSV